MRELHRSAYFLVTVDDDRKIVRRARTAQAYGSATEVEAAYQAMLDALAPIDRATHGLLADLRLAPPRNDPAFEQLVRRYYRRLYGGFRQIAVLVKTEAGRLQIARLMPDEFVPLTRTFTDEAAAIAHLEARPAWGRRFR